MKSWLLLLQGLCTSPFLCQNHWISWSLPLNLASQWQIRVSLYYISLFLHQVIFNTITTALSGAEMKNTTCKFLTYDANKTLVCAMVVSQLDYRNSLLYHCGSSLCSTTVDHLSSLPLWVFYLLYHCGSLLYHC